MNNMSFTDELKALFGQYNQNINLIRKESTEEIFNYIIRYPNKQIRSTTLANIQIGKFYIIKYNYNGNKLWCPILTIPPIKNSNELGILESQLKIVNIKKILYAINFDYLPVLYKAQLIDSIIQANPDRYDKNSDKISKGDVVNNEFNFNVNWIYQYLKINGKKNYSITAYDISKIENVYQVSSTILQRFVFLDTYKINNGLMYDTLNNIVNNKLKLDFSDKIKIYEEILKLYEKDIENFYTSLKNFEKNLKLIENL